jgi:hypothetical protein
MKFTHNRYCAIHEDLKLRGYAPTSFHENWNDIPINYYNDYATTDEEHCMLTERIKERINSSKKKTWHYYKKSITKDEAVEILLGKNSCH